MASSYPNVYGLVVSDQTLRPNKWNPPSIRPLTYKGSKELEPAKSNQYNTIYC